MYYEEHIAGYILLFRDLRQSLNRLGAHLYCAAAVRERKYQKCSQKA